MASDIRHDQAAHRFTTTVDGVEGCVEYAVHGGVMSVNHTIVPQAIGGRGIAGDLVQAALEYARHTGLKVHPACSYADAYLRRHAEYADLVA